DALIAWLKSEQKISDLIRTDTAKADDKKADQIKTDKKLDDAKDATIKADATKGDSIFANSFTNPLNAALQSFITAGGVQNTPLNLGSLQFLKNNSIALAGLNIADPSLLTQAYQMASQKLLITLLPEINTSNLNTTQAEKTGEQSRADTIQKRLVDDIRIAMQDNAIPLNMQSYLVLWTAITLPATQAQGTQNPVVNPAVTQIASSSKDVDLTNQETIAAGANVAAQVAQSIVSVTGLLPASPIVASVLASIPALSNDTGTKITDALTDQLGMLSYIYSQMAPYWSGPAAVSLMAASRGGEVTEQKKLESSVRAFAIALGALLNDPTFDKILAAIIKKAMPNIPEEQLKIFIAAMKVSVLTNALVALYIVLLRKTNGQFRADELAQLILGPPIDERGDIDDLLKGIVKSIQTELLYIPVARRAAFINNLLSAYDASTDINALVDPTKQFLNLLDTTLNQDSAASTKG
ncbi:MAG: hypothetical protein LLF94_03405, partial [Chlamydiales bacterium]|nr:hypothetical protein [Chlamydiales bacterium]